MPVLESSVLTMVPAKGMPGMPMPAAGTGGGVLIGAYCLVSAAVWIAYGWRTARARGDARTVSSYVAMTAAMGVTLLTLR